MTDNGKEWCSPERRYLWNTNFKCQKPGQQKARSPPEATGAAPAHGLRGSPATPGGCAAAPERVGTPRSPNTARGAAQYIAAARNEPFCQVSTVFRELVLLKLPPKTSKGTQKCYQWQIGKMLFKSMYFCSLGGTSPIPSLRIFPKSIAFIIFPTNC